MKYDYEKAMKQDIYEAICQMDTELGEGEDRHDMIERIYDKLCYDDSVTGNASGSYTFNRYEAQDYVQDNWDVLIDALFEFGYDNAYLGEKIVTGHWEVLDVLIRCSLLRRCLEEVMDEYFPEG